MTEIEQQIAIAEKCGIEICWPHEDKQVTDEVTIPESYPYRTVTRHYFVCQKCKRIRGGLVADTFPDTVPDYLHDLNAMHEAEKTLTEKQQAIYLTRLLQVRYRNGADHGMMACMVDKLAFATAPQRAEAFLRTIGKWKETKCCATT